MLKKCLLIVVFHVSLAILVYSQKYPGAGGSNISNFPGQQQLQEEIKDSFINQYSNIYNPNKKINFIDTSLNNFFQQYTPDKRRDIPFINLGNAGSATFNPLFDFKRQIGFNTGFHQYDAYNQKLNDFRFYECNRTFADLMFTNITGALNNFYVKADFTQQFKNDVSYSINYDRISQVGYYTNQGTKTTNFTFSNRFKSAKGKLLTYLTYKNMVNQEEVNGGVTDESLFFVSGFAFRQRIPVQLNDAVTRHDRKMFIITNHFLPKKDSASAFSFIHDFQYEFSYYKFTDKDVKEDSIYYGNNLLDSRGIRYYNSIKRLSNTLYMKGKIKKFDGTFSFTHDLFLINDENVGSTRNDLTLGFNGNVGISTLAGVEVDAKLGVGENIGTFDVGGKLAIPIAKVLSLNGNIQFFRSEVPYIYNNLRLNNTQVYTNNFTSPLGTQINGSLAIPSLKFRFNISQSVISNLLYWKDAQTPAQLNEAYSNTSISLHHDMRFWILGMTNDGFYQVNSSDVLPLSSWYTRHGLFGELRLFKKILLLRFGAELTLFPQYQLPAYSAVLGQFYKSNDERKLFPATDIYITAKVDNFRLFVRLENYTNNFVKQINYYVSGHPQFDPKVRFGVRWQLLD